MNSLHGSNITSDPENPAENPFVVAHNASITKMTIEDVLSDSNRRLVRARFSKTSMFEYLNTLSDLELREKYVRFHDKHRYFDQVCAGAKHHHWWVGGLQDHCREMTGVALDMFSLYRGDLEGKVTRDDIIIGVYLHDFAKIWTYEFITDEDRERAPKKYLEQQLFKPINGAFNIIDEESKTLLELARFGIIPTDTQWSAVLFAEGGYSDRNFTYGGRSRTGDTVMSHNPLAVMIHIADMYSSQVLGGSIA